MKLYAISGLGADQRVFDYLTLNHKLTHINWITPKKNESIENYSFRLSKKIKPNETFGLLGVSFGGLIATEMAKILSPKLTILISSAEIKSELRSIYSLFGKINIIKLIPEKLFNPPKRISYFLFGARNKKLLTTILGDTDLKFTKWAVTQLISWKNKQRVTNCIKISGSKDKLIPPTKNGNFIIIKEGEHFMIIDKAKEISNIINQKIDELSNS